jgi:hypothetical protein
MLTARDLEKQTRPKENGAADGKKDFPSTDAGNFASETEQQIRSLCQDEVAKEYDAFLKAISKVRHEAAAIGSSIPANITVFSNNILARLKNIVSRHTGAVGQAAAEIERRGKDLRQFKIINDLTYEPSYDDSIINLVGTAIFIIACESAANAYFFGQASERGLAGGFFTAGMISLMNVTLGFITGLCALRQFNHVKKWRLILAIPALLFIFPAAVVFNLIVGHYREALIKNPDELILEIIPTAMSNLLDIRSFESIILVIVGLFIFCFSLYKGYSVWDTYPGYMSKHKSMKEAEHKLEDERARASEDIDDELGLELQEFDNLGPVLKSKHAAVGKLRQGLDTDLAALNSTIEQIGQAANTAIKIYQTANQEVRSRRVPPPQYFRTEFKFDRITETVDLKAAREELSSLGQHVVSAQTEFQAAQLNLSNQRIAITEHLGDSLANAEEQARRQTRAEREEEKAGREALRMAEVES